MSQREGSKVDFQSQPSVSPLPHLEAKILQTHNLARLLTGYAEQLFQEYVQHQGDPFGLPSFSPPRLPVPGLSPPAASHVALPTLQRLQLDATALGALPPLLDAVRLLQADLNPYARRLLRHLDEASRRTRALAGAVEALLGALGEAGGPQAPPRPNPSQPPGVFLAKLLGYQVCRLYQEWVNRTEEDLGQLARGEET